jgi:hypothetical protein
MQAPDLWLERRCRAGNQLGNRGEKCLGSKRLPQELSGGHLPVRATGEIPSGDEQDRRPPSILLAASSATSPLSASMTANPASTSMRESSRRSSSSSSTTRTLAGRAEWSVGPIVRCRLACPYGRVSRSAPGYTEIFVPLRPRYFFHFSGAREVAAPRTGVLKPDWGSIAMQARLSTTPLGHSEPGSTTPSRTCIRCRCSGCAREGDEATALIPDHTPGRTGESVVH